MRCRACGQWNREGASRCVFCGNDPASDVDQTVDLADPGAPRPDLIVIRPPRPRRRSDRVPPWLRIALPAAVLLAWTLLVRLCR